MFQSPFSFNGRIRRLEFGISFIIYWVILLFINAFPERGQDRGTAIFFLLCYIPLLWFFWAQGAKRCHDLGKSGWWLIVPFYVFWMIFEDGQIGDNEYGDNPKGLVYETEETDEGKNPFVTNHSHSPSETVAGTAVNPFLTDKKDKNDSDSIPF